MELFISSGFSKIEEVIMVPGKQYSFAIFSDEYEAQKAVETMSGNKCLPGNKHPLYMTCINESKRNVFDIKVFIYISFLFR